MASSDWQTVSPDTLEANTLALYLAAKEQYRVYKAARQAFEAQMNEDMAEHMPCGQELKFGYNFGKLSVAVGPKTERRAKKAAETLSLGDWLQAQAAQGRSA